MNHRQRAPGILLSFTLSLASLPATAILLTSAPAKGSEGADIVFVQAPVVAAGGLTARFPQGCRLVRMAGGERSRFVVNLTPEFFAAADPQVSYDGARLLFSGQKARADHWQIWEMRLDGSEKRQLTHCAQDCLRPAYLSHDEMVFTALSCQGLSTSSCLMVAKRDGSEPHPITFGPGNFVVETVLRDGRILASARSPLLAGGATQDSRDLYTLRLDGTGLASFRCNHRERVNRTQAEELDDGSVVFVKRSPGGHEVGGELARIRRGTAHNSSLTPNRSVSWPSPLPGAGSLIVAREDRSRQGGSGKFDLYAFELATSKFGDLIFGAPDVSSVQAVPVAAHPQPRWYWSTVNPKAQGGYFICLDSYRSAEAPNGRLSTPIAKVRVLTLEPVTNRERALGVAPVEKDGSFYIAVPPDRPVRFELLDTEGSVIRAQRSWIWARPGDEHGCVGCHEDKALAPPNRWPLTLRRFDTPTRLGFEPGFRTAQ